MVGTLRGDVGAFRGHPQTHVPQQTNFSQFQEGFRKISVGAKKSWIHHFTNLCYTKRKVACATSVLVLFSNLKESVKEKADSNHVIEVSLNWHLRGKKLIHW